MSSAVCTHCGCSDIDTDPARGDAVCTSCGSVLEDQIIVSEVQFQENAAGGSSVIGQYVSAEGNKSLSIGSGFHHGFGKESRAITLQNGKKKIQQLGDQLRLNQHCIDTGYNFFKMAVNKRLTRGRKTTHVIAACLYLVCRTEGTPHMLLDFSDILQVNVYSLGRTYLQLSRELCINIPALDPCLYIHRFAHKLEFAEKTHEVSMTALRLVSRMKRDWMSAGRRPSGLCGAALLVAARIHDFSRTIREMIKVVKIGGSTIRKRLAEFEQTPSSQLTIDEFQKIDLEEESDPPCFTEGRRRAKLAQLEEAGQLPALTSEISDLQCEIEKALEETLLKKSRHGKDVDSLSVCSSAPSITDLEDELSQCNKFLEEDTLKQTLGDRETDSKKSVIASDISETEGKDPVVASMEREELNSLFMPPPPGAPTPPLSPHPPTKSPSTPVPSSPSVGVSLFGPRPTAASLGIKESIEECLKVPEGEEKEDGNGELDVSGINDEELDVYLLTEDEVKVKTKIWMTANKEYLEEMKAKAEKEAKLEEMGINVKDQKKKKRSKKKTNQREANSAGEAIEKMLQEKKISSKINYDVLKDLNKTKQDPEPVPFLGSGPIEATPVSLRPTSSRFKRPSVSVDIKSEIKLEKTSPPVKKPKLELSSGIGSPPPVSQPSDIVVESGPVEYADDAEAEEDYYDDDDEEHISAAQLMGHTADHENYGDYDEDLD